MPKVLNRLIGSDVPNIPTAYQIGFVSFTVGASCVLGGSVVGGAVVGGSGIGEPAIGGSDAGITPGFSFIYVPPIFHRFIVFIIKLIAITCTISHEKR